jgi:hypothetical protein
MGRSLLTIGADYVSAIMVTPRMVSSDSLSLARRFAWFVIATIPVAVACSSGAGADVQPPSQPSADGGAGDGTTGGGTAIGPGGGVVQGPDGVTMNVPEGALDTTVEIRIERVDASTILTLPAESSVRLAATGLRVEPDGLAFAQPVVIRMPKPAGFTSASADTFVLSAPANSHDFEDLPASIDGDFLEFSTFHLSNKLPAQLGRVDTHTVDELIYDAKATCTTSLVRGLARQLLKTVSVKAVVAFC